MTESGDVNHLPHILHPFQNSGFEFGCGQHSRRTSVGKHVGKSGRFQKIWKSSLFLGQVLRNFSCVVLCCPQDFNQTLASLSYFPTELRPQAAVSSYLGRLYFPHLSPNSLPPSHSTRFSNRL